MKLLLAFLACSLGSSQQLGDIQLVNGIRCCDRMKGDCSPGLLSCDTYFRYPSYTPHFIEAPSREDPSREAPSKPEESREAPSREAPSREAPSREAPSREAPSREAPSKSREVPSRQVPSKSVCTRRICTSTKPSIIPIIPTQYVRNVFIPSPTTWLMKQRINFTQLNITRPETIVGGFSLRVPNISIILRPAKLQELQIQLACTFRIPIEKLQITRVINRMTEQSIPYDRSILGLRSNGTVLCIRNERLRNLQEIQQGSENVYIEYAIIEPTDEILSLDDSEFDQISRSEHVDTYLASVDGSYASSETPNKESTSKQDVIVGVAAGIGSLFLCIALLAFFMYVLLPPPSAPNPQPSAVVNPIHSMV